MGPRSHAKGQLLGERTCPGMPDNTGELCKMAELIDLPFGLWTQVGRRKQKLNRIRQVAPTYPHGNRPSAAAMRPMSNYIDHLLYYYFIKTVTSQFYM